MTVLVWLIAGIFGVIGVAPCLADVVPPQLREKSIQVSWVDHRIERVVIEQREVSGNQSNSLVVYISSKGRIFSKMDRSFGHASQRDNDVSGSGKTAIAWSYQGRTLHGHVPYNISGAGRLTIQFDESFSGCSISVIRGKDQGKPRMYVNIARTYVLEMISIRTTSSSCAIRPGNLFAN